MKPVVLVAVILILNVVGYDRPMAFAQTMGTAAPQSIGTPSSAYGEQATPSPDSRIAPLPDLQGFPTAPAPSELATLALPDNFTEVTALFKRLPPEIAGHARSPQFDRIAPDRSIVGYGEMRIGMARNHFIGIQAIDLTKGDFFPINWKAGHVVVMMAGRGEGMEEFGRDGDLFWVRQRFGLIWGRIDSPWMFSVQADTPESRDALHAAFVAAVKSARR
jgi:hypothetical protein